MKVERVARVLVTLEADDATAADEFDELFEELERIRFTFTKVQQKPWDRETLEFIEWEPEPSPQAWEELDAVLIPRLRKSGMSPTLADAYAAKQREATDGTITCGKCAENAVRRDGTGLECAHCGHRYEGVS